MVLIVTLESHFLSRSWPTCAEFLLVSIIDTNKSKFFEHLAPADIQWFLGQANDECLSLLRKNLVRET
jgi:hypothetical protein